MMIEICLIILGIVAVIASFLLGEKVSPEQAFTQDRMSEQLKKTLEESVAGFRNQARDLSEDAQEETERALEKICNEKIMAIQDDSNSVFEEIEKNHQEVVFLYSMLDDKKKELETLMSSLRAETKETRELVQDMMLARDIAQMMEQEIVMGRKVVSDIQKVTEASQLELEASLEAMKEAEEQFLKRKDTAEAAEAALAEVQRLQEERVARAAEEEKEQRLQQEKAVKAAEAAIAEAKRLQEEKAEKAREQQEHSREERAEVDGQARRLREAEAARARKNSEMKDVRKEQPVIENSKTEEQTTVKEAVVKEAPTEETAVSETKRVTRRAVRKSVAETTNPFMRMLRSKESSEKEQSMLQDSGDFKKQILEMHKSGMDETEIAKELSMGVGEVKLVIGLFEGAKA